MNRAQAVFHRHHLRLARQQIHFAAPQAGQEIGDLAIDQMTAIELGGDLNRQPHARPGLLHRPLFRDRPQEVAAKSDKSGHLTLEDALAGFDRVHALLAWRLEIEELSQPVERHQFRLLGNADGALPLHVRMPAHRRHAGPLASDIPLHQKQVHIGRDILEAVHMLGQAHAIDADGLISLDIDRARRLDRRPGEPRYHLDLGPLDLPHARLEGLEADRVLGDEGAVDNLAIVGLCCIVSRQHMLAEPEQHGDIAARLYLVILAGKLCRVTAHHRHWILRTDHALEPALAHGVEGHDPAAALYRCLQVMQEARAVRACILAKEKDRIAMLEIVEHDSADRRADHLLQGDGCRLVAHVGAVGQVVVAVGPGKQRPAIGRLQARPPGCVKHRFLRIHPAKLLTDRGKRLIPGTGHVVIAHPVVAHRMRQPPELLKIVIAERLEFGHAVPGKDFQPRLPPRQFPKRRLGAILAKLDGFVIGRFRPGAGDTGKATRLVLLEKGGDGARADAFFTDDTGDPAKRPPAPCRSIIRHRRIIFCHHLFPSRVVLRRGNDWGRDWLRGDGTDHRHEPVSLRRGLSPMDVRSIVE